MGHSQNYWQLLVMDYTTAGNIPNGTLILGTNSARHAAIPLSNKSPIHCLCEAQEA